MSGRSFHSVFMVASCAAAALSCYLVSLRVASERAALEEVEAKIVLAERDLRLLQTEIGTRGRLAQLERWNAKVLALSAPSADQLLQGSFALASLIRPQPKLQLEAPVVLATAPARETPAPLDEGEMQPSESGNAKELLHQASLNRNRIAAAERDPAIPGAKTPHSVPSEKAAGKKLVENKAVVDAMPVTKPARKPIVDPLAPLAVPSPSSTAKDAGTTR